VVVPETFPCAPLDAVLTERACQNNQLRAMAEKQAGRITFIAKCLTCPCPIKKLERADEPELPPVHDLLGLPLRAHAKKSGRKMRARIRKETNMAKAEAPRVKVESPPPENVRVAVVVEPAPGPNVALEPVPKCKRHPDRDAIVNGRGISTGKCRECIETDGKTGGDIRKNPVAFMLRDPRHEALLNDLQEAAEANERTLEQEVIFRLKKTL
jgi:hypothetical protein